MSRFTEKDNHRCNLPLQLPTDRRFAYRTFPAISHPVVRVWLHPFLPPRHVTLLSLPFVRPVLVVTVISDSVI